MSLPRTLCLRFGNDIPSIVRSRIEYAFRVFCAIYDYKVADEGAPSDVMYCDYGLVSDPGCSCSLRIPTHYRANKPCGSATIVARGRHAGEDVPVFYGLEQTTGLPDWLGEIFEWISSSTEKAAARRDAVGRIPYSETIFARGSISPRKPFAAVLMSWLGSAIAELCGTKGLPKAPSPMVDADHIVVCCHDIDFYHTSAASTFKRLVKNLGISGQLYRSWRFLGCNIRMMARRLVGQEVADYVGPLLAAGANGGFTSTLFVASRSQHRRDPNYQLSQLAPQLKDAVGQGFSVALHASYESVVERDELQHESAAFSETLGKWPRGSRQHWLRFDTHEKLFRSVERAQLLFDSSVGFAETVGFRNAASFAFPPYDFDKERAYDFLEIPLVLMDGSLEAAARHSGEEPDAIAEEILAESRKWGWGGIAAVWHNPIEAIQVPPEINGVFWNCVARQRSFREKWINADQFLAACLGRYQDAGLMRPVRLDA